jgi:signal transduction histidine kinase
LRAIEGFTEALIDEFGSGTKENAEDYGRRIKTGVRRMGAMIDDLLRLAKAVRSEMTPTTVDLGALTREIMEKLQSQDSTRRCDVTVANDLIATGDAGLLRLAMENLLANAWKYSSRREIAKIEVGVVGPRSEKVFFVRDNGVGFDMAEADRLFAPFHRLSSGSSFEGTGVGLATVQRIVRRHGGQISAESAPDRGATFIFSLPNS